ncbi:PGPGW domain-containing protein [Cellulomonas sp. NPDC089187]|uniref:PGPGW domain-containing protein n=1 Tax=Cellulomonas sp. NPDC089187 TaxID=3154970 RepID=UPI00343B5198
MTQPAPDGLAGELDAAERSPLLHRMSALRARLHRRRATRLLYRALVTAVGVTLVAVGVLLLVLPGPGWLMIFLGLGVLGTEFPAIRRMTDRFKARVLRVWRRWRARRA